MSETKNKKMTPAEYEQAKQLRVTGQKTIKDIAAQFGVSEQALRKRFSRDGVEVLEEAVEEHVAGVTDLAAQKLAESIALHQKRVQDTKEIHYKLAEQFTALVARKTKTAIEDKISLATLIPEFKAIKLALEISQTAKQIRYDVLEINNGDVDPEDMPELPIVEITDEEAHEIGRSKGLNFEEDDELVAGAESDTEDADSDPAD